jgi:hypothetical protein
LPNRPPRCAWLPARSLPVAPSSGVGTAGAPAPTGHCKRISGVESSDPKMIMIVRAIVMIIVMMIRIIIVIIIMVIIIPVVVVIIIVTSLHHMIV